jgi:hypothetical protein
MEEGPNNKADQQVNNAVYTLVLRLKHPQTHPEMQGCHKIGKAT